MSKFSMRCVRKHNIGFTFLCVLSLSTAHSLMAFPEGLGVRSRSMGEAYRAVASGNDIMFYNPAGLIKNRHIGGDADYLLATDSRLHSLTVSVVDSRTTAWGIGLGYNASINTKTDLPTTHLAYMAIAIPLGTDQISFGTGLSYVYDPQDDNLPHKHFFNMDLGIYADLGAGLYFAVVADHFLEKKGNEKSLGLNIGTAFALGDLIEAIPLTTSFDWSMRDIKSDADLDHVMGLGFQYLAFTMVPLRFGYTSQLKTKDHHFSLGTGLMVEGFALDALYQQHVTLGRLRHFGIAVRIEI